MERDSNAKFKPAENTIYVNFKQSDGDQSTWPQNTARIADSAGQVDFMEHVPINEGAAIRWRTQVGRALTKVLYRLAEGSNYVLQDWPTGYRMFIHKKGPVSSPRQDVYLFGSINSPGFRSIPEFVPHAIWLFGEQKAKCQCKYCSKTKQREITSSMRNRGILEQITPGPSSLVLPLRSGRGTSENQLAVYASIQEIKRPSASATSMHAAPMKDAPDVDVAYPDSSNPRLCGFRNNELVWFVLNTPIPGCKRNGDIIEAWPAIVEDSSQRVVPGSRLEHRSGPRSHGNAFIQIDDPQNSLLPVTHHSAYKLKLLATSYSLMALDDQILPYQAYLPPTELIEALREVPFSQIKFDAEYTTNFTPIVTTATYPDEQSYSGPMFEDSTGPYALALQIGSQIAKSWGLTDKLNGELSSVNNPPLASTSRTEYSSLPEAIGAASRHNASQNSPRTTSSHMAGNRHAVEELHRTESASCTSTQKIFQELWWGAERIWIGDLLRLKIGRRALTEASSPHILAPSPAGPDTLSYNNALLDSNEVDVKDLSARSRGVFMKLGALLMVEVEDSGGNTRRECRVAGALYELSDADWVNPLEEESVGAKKKTSGNHSHSLMTDSILVGESNNEHYQRRIPFSHYELPQPPTGFKFRPIVDPGYEAVFSLALVSGRYYPGILGHSLLKKAISNQPLGKSDFRTCHLWALEGLEAGFANSMDPSKYGKDRLKMIIDGEKNARRQLSECFMINVTPSGGQQI
ncbi:hypothetical protein EV360DRAFT_57422 [Lentinula raphanica]|nr:hypothetical protein EV360DRAFT_57422 [Lentinula raphanica]